MKTVFTILQLNYVKERHAVRDSIVHLLYISGPAIIQLKLEHKQGKNTEKF